MASWRVAKSLLTLRDQVDAEHPLRSKVSDGTVGDVSHAARVSDHNPGPDGVVEAMDLTHDLAHGVDTWAMAETLRLNRDARIDYVISNGRIFSGQAGSQPWVWRKYTGSNSHAKHIHVSVDPNKSIYDQTQPWNLKRGDNAPPMTPAPEPPKPPGITDEMRRRMMQKILSYEGRFDGGNLQVFIAPDGLPEIGGITQKDHPAVYARLKSLLGKQDELRDAVLDYYDSYTDQAQNWTDRAGLEFFLRDCILNRGPAGAAEILQMAVKTKIDRQIGPTTRGALAALSFDNAISKLRQAREDYEDIKYGKAFRVARRQWDGLVNRWNHALEHAKQFQSEQASATPSQMTPPPPPSDERGVS